MSLATVAAASGQEIVPFDVREAHKSVFRALTDARSRHGGSRSTARSTVPFESRKTASMVNLMKAVWMELQGEIQSPSPSSSRGVVRRPTMRDTIVSATRVRSARTEARV